MQARQRLLPFTVAAILSLAASRTAAADVRIAGELSNQSFTTIQAAVDAAPSASVLLVGSGIYAGFVIDDKALWVVAATGAQVSINGTVEVRNLAPAHSVVLSRLQATGATVAVPGVSLPALRLTNNLGVVRIQKCVFTGGEGGEEESYCDFGEPAFGHGGAAAVVTNSTKVALHASVLQGGAGGGTLEDYYDCTGGNGGEGVHAQDSSVAFYECLAKGGQGGNSGLQGGQGSNGYVANGGDVFASKCAFEGGRGGYAWDYIAAFGGDGGDGLVIDNVLARLLDSQTLGGAGGVAIIFTQNNGAAGAPVSGTSTVETIAGSGRSFLCAPMTSDASAFSVAVTGLPGDRVWLPKAFAPGFGYSADHHGVWLLPFPAKMPLAPIGTIPASGTLTVQVPITPLAASVVSQRIYFQGYIRDAQGLPTLGSPIELLVLNRDAAPDCNANGVLDYFDTIEGQSADCNQNLVPDACDPDCNANGTPDGCDISAGHALDCNGNNVPDQCENFADCNANAVPDECDIASHLSADFDANAMPDECQANAVHFVDDSAAAGGDGSFGAPFQRIAQGIAASISGDTVIVRDGVYTGAGNKNLDFGGRNLTLTSANGPANCVIDCENAGRAFNIHSGESALARIEGLTITRGVPPEPAGVQRGGGILVTDSTPTISGCVITRCSANRDGGALFYTANTPFVIEGCTFQSNEVIAPGSSALGVVYLNGPARIKNCSFEDNHSANLGGAIMIQGGQSAFISHSRFLANSAGAYGGAILNSIYAGQAGTTGLFVDDCLFAGNSSNEGGAIATWSFGNKNRLWITNSTLSANGGNSGVALWMGSASTARVANSIIHGNLPTSVQITTYESSSIAFFDYCDIEGGLSGIDQGSGTIIWGAGNLDVDPHFVDADGPDRDRLDVFDNDYRLAALSQCVDAGDSGRVPLDLTDIDGDGDLSEHVPLDLGLGPRFVDDRSVTDTGAGSVPIVDMGALERQP